MTLFLLITVASLVLAGLAAVVHAVRNAPEGFESEHGYIGRPPHRTVAIRQSKAHPVSIHGTQALLH